jgi:hypothetical protein
MVKKCFKCKEERQLSQFYIHKQMRDGHLNKCISCTKKDIANNVANYDKTLKGVIRVIYKTQKRNSKIRQMEPPQYTKKELTEWLLKNNIIAYYNAWVNSEYQKKYKPSVDRIDDFLPYTFTNIRLVTWGENFNHFIDDLKSGIGTAGMRNKITLQYNEGNECVAKYVSYSAAKRCVGYSFDKIVNTGKKDKNGYKWAYKEFVDQQNNIVTTTF